MSNYDGELQEWLKYVAQQVKAAGKPAEVMEEEHPEQNGNGREDELPPQNVIVRDRMGSVSLDSDSVVDAESVIANPTLLEDRPKINDRRARLFDESDMPNVEDYLPFLSEPREQDEPKWAEPSPEDQGMLFGIEGTGEPKPVIRTPEPEPVKEESHVVKAEAPSVVETPPQKPAPVRAVKRPVLPPVGANAEEVQEMWDKLPRHIQLLVGTSGQEVAQNSYKKFKETRDELVARLLDPTLSLEETARILNVCPTTVRRYTNRGALRHLRTAGNQRRFRLSDVLAFLESNGDDK